MFETANDWVFMPSVWAPTTGLSIPPARPSQSWPKRSTTKL